jgi:hypothetical protein
MADQLGFAMSILTDGEVAAPPFFDDAQEGGVGAESINELFLPIGSPFAPEELGIQDYYRRICRRILAFKCYDSPLPSAESPLKIGVDRFDVAPNESWHC